jgi:predicted  nucleic acid-binding Zn-ribbon protein
MDRGQTLSLIDVRITENNLQTFKRLEEECGKHVAHAFGLIVEHFDGMFKGIREANEIAKEKLDRDILTNEDKIRLIEMRMNHIEITLSETIRKFKKTREWPKEKVKYRILNLENEIAEMNKKLLGMEGDTDLIKNRIKKIEKQIKGIKNFTK